MRAVLQAIMMSATLIGVAHAQDTPAPPAAQAPSMVIYEDQLAPGWSNWSWADVQLGVNIGDPTEHPISVRADGWEALYLQHAPFSTAGFTALTFYAHGGASGGQRLHVLAVDERGEALPNSYVQVTLAPNAWSEVVMPLADIGAANRTVGGFWIQNGTGETQPRFLVNLISLR